MNDARRSNSARQFDVTDEQLSAELKKWTGATPALHPVGELLDRHWEAAFTYARLCTDGTHAAGMLTTAAFTRLFGESLRQAGPTAAWRSQLLLTVRRIAGEWDNDGRREQLHPGLRSGTGPGERAAVRLLPPTDRRLLARAFQRLPQSARAALWHTEVECEPFSVRVALLGLDEQGAEAEVCRARERLREECVQAHRELATEDECLRYSRMLDVTFRRGGTTVDPDLQDHLSRCAHCDRTAGQLDQFNGYLGVALAEAVLGWGARDYVESRAAMIAQADPSRPVSDEPSGRPASGLGTGGAFGPVAGEDFAGTGATDSAPGAASASLGAASPGAEASATATFGPAGGDAPGPPAAGTAWSDAAWGPGTAAPDTAAWDAAAGLSASGSLGTGFAGEVSHGGGRTAGPVAGDDAAVGRAARAGRAKDRRAGGGARRAVPVGSVLSPRSALRTARRMRRRNLALAVATVSALVVVPLVLWTVLAADDDDAAPAAGAKPTVRPSASPSSRIGASAASKGTLSGSLRNTGSGLCVDVVGGKAVEGAETELAKCSARATQHWTYEKDGLLRSDAAPELCLDSHLGYSVRLAPCAGGPKTSAKNIRYDFTSKDALVPRWNQDLALTPAATDGGGALVLKTRADTAAQRWTIGTSEPGLQLVESDHR